MNIRFVVLAALVAVGLSACSKGKQEAAVALDEARLSVESARKSGAEPKLLGQAEKELENAETHFGGGRYPKARSSAQRAVDAARMAKSEGGQRSRPVPATRRQAAKKKGSR